MFDYINYDVFLYMSVKLLGGVAQLGERLPCTQEAIGSSPFTSTKYLEIVIFSFNWGYYQYTVL